LALALAAEGARVGVLDADVYGPSIPTMLGLSGKPESPDGKSIVPVRAHGLEAMSIGLLVEHDTPMIWRGPMATQALTQLLTQTLWGGEEGLDYLVVDLPPGTGDIQLTLAQKIPVAGALVVTTPQEVATMDARKALKMFEKVQIHVLGLVENMAVHVCSQCGHAEHVFGSGGGERMAAQYGVPLLGSLPLELAIREQGDAGVPLVAAAPGSPAAEAYRALARNVVAELDKRPRAPMSIAASLACPPYDPRFFRGIHEHQERPLDPADGRRPGDDRAVRARAGEAPRRWRPDRQLRHLELRLRRALLARVQGVHQHQLDDRRSEELRPGELRRHRGGRMHHPAEFVRAGAHGRVLPDPARHPGGVPGQEHLRALRDHRQRDPAGTRVGGPRDPGVLQHHAAAGAHLCQRGRRADAVLPGRRGRRLRDLVQGSRREIPGPARSDAAAHVGAMLASRLPRGKASRRERRSYRSSASRSSRMRSTSASAS